MKVVDIRHATFWERPLSSEVSVFFPDTAWTATLEDGQKATFFRTEIKDEFDAKIILKYIRNVLEERHQFDDESPVVDNYKALLIGKEI